MKKNKLERMDYPGRGVMVGVTSEKDVFGVTFVQGRSPSSQARRYAQANGKIWTEPTDKKTLAKGNPDLLLYNCIMWHGGVIALSNGKQTDSILANTLAGIDPVYEPADFAGSLEECTRQWNYEPDDPNFTPRISGRITMQTSYLEDNTMALGIIKRRKDGTAYRKTYDVSPEAGTDEGKAFFITTYTGVNANPLPSFKGAPQSIPIDSITVDDLCHEVGEMLNPDLRVAVAVMMMDQANDVHTALLNYRG
ncbi:IMP cyclohydrolase [Nanoarchaeota archaeon]